MASGKGIPGIAVFVATGGALLLYAGFQGVSPLQALKDVSTGKLPTLKGSTFVSGATSSAAVSGSQVGVALVQAAYGHQGELYSQSRRWDQGYSDCSSFVGKSLTDIGIKYPGSSVTGDYLVWSGCQTVDRGSIEPGDLLVSSGHIAIAISNTMAIGQQNSRDNVKVDTIDNIMWGQSGWIPRRYTGGVPYAPGYTPPGILASPSSTGSPIGTSPGPGAGAPGSGTLSSGGIYGA